MITGVLGGAVLLDSRRHCLISSKGKLRQIIPPISTELYLTTRLSKLQYENK